MQGKPALSDRGQDSAIRSHRSERTHRLKLAVLTSLAIKPLALLIPLVTVPMFLGYLGAERYGLYESAGALGAWLALTNAGMGLGLMNRLTECYVDGDRALARRYVSTLAFALMAIGGTLVVAAITVIPLVNWGDVFATRDPRAAAEASMAVSWVTVLTVAALFLSVPSAIYSAYQDQVRNNLWDAAAKVSTLMASWLVVRTDLGVSGVILAMVGAPVIVRLGNVAHLFGVEKPWLRPRLRDFDLRLLRRLLQEGLALLVLQTASVAIFQSDKLIISHSLGSDAVASYAILGRLFAAVNGLVMLFLAPLWPAYGEALGRRDLVWVRRTYWRSLLLGCTLMLAVGGILSVVHGAVLAWWTRQAVDVQPSLIVAMTGAYTTWIWVGCHSVILNAAGVVRPQLLLMAAHAVLNVTLALLLVKTWGTAGVAWSITLSGLVTTIIGYPLLLWRFVLNKSVSGEKP